MSHHHPLHFSFLKFLIFILVGGFTTFINPYQIHAVDYINYNPQCPLKESFNWDQPDPIMTPGDSRLTSRPVYCDPCNNDVPRSINSSAGNFHYYYRINYNSSETFTCDGGSCDYNLESCSIDFPEAQSPYDPDHPSLPNPDLDLESTQLLVGPKAWSGGFNLNAHSVILPFVGNDNQESREKYIADYIDGTLSYKSPIDPPSHPASPDIDHAGIFDQDADTYFTIPPSDPRFFMYSSIFSKLSPQTYTDVQKRLFYRRVEQGSYRDGISPIHNITISDWLGEDNSNERATVVEFYTDPSRQRRDRPLPPGEEHGASTWEAYFHQLQLWQENDNGKWARLWTILPTASREDVRGEFDPLVQSPAYLSPLSNPTPTPLVLPHLARLYESANQLSDLLRPASSHTNTTSSIVPASSNQNQLASLQSFSPSNHLLAQSTTAPTPTADPTATPTAGPTPTIDLNGPTPTPDPRYTQGSRDCIPAYVDVHGTNSPSAGEGRGQRQCLYAAEIKLNFACGRYIYNNCCGTNYNETNCPWSFEDATVPGDDGLAICADAYIPDRDDIRWNFSFGDSWGSFISTHGGVIPWTAAQGQGNGIIGSSSEPFYDYAIRNTLAPHPILEPLEIFSFQAIYQRQPNRNGGKCQPGTICWNWMTQGILNSPVLTCQAPPAGGWDSIGESCVGQADDTEDCNACKCNYTGPIPITPPPPYCGPTQLSSVPQSSGDIRTGPGDNLCGQQSYSIGYNQETFWNANAWETNTTVPDPVNPPGGTDEDKTNWFGDCSAEYRSSFCGAEIACTDCSCAAPNQNIAVGYENEWCCDIPDQGRECGTDPTCGSSCPAGECVRTAITRCCGPDENGDVNSDNNGNCLNPPANTSSCCPDSAPNCGVTGSNGDFETRCAIRPYGTDENGDQIVYGYEPAFDPPPKELYYTAQREVHLATRLPYLGKIWDTLVDDKRSLYKLITPYRGQLTTADPVPWYDFHDGEASGWLTVSNTGNQFTSISDTRLPFFFPHLGGIQDATTFVRDCLTSAAVYNPNTGEVSNNCSPYINEQSRECIARFNKISIMVNADTGEVLPFIQAMANAGTPVKAITLMDSSINALASQIKAISPTTIIIGRVYSSNFGSNLPDPSTSIPETLASWRASLGDNINNPSVDYWQGYNEPAVDTPQKMQWLANFEAARANSMGGKVCIGNFSTGNPNPDYWDDFEPAFAAIEGGNGIVCLHEYSMTTDMNIDGYNLGRFQAMYNQIGDRDIRTVISETGIDLSGGATTDGWRARTTLDNFLQGLTGYDQFLNQFPRVIGATTYILGHPGWPSFELSGDFMTAITQGTQQLTSPGIECTAAGSGSTPPSTLPPGTTVDLQGLGVFTNLGAGSVDEICNGMGSTPRVVTLLNNFDQASEIRSQCGADTIIVGRKYFGEDERPSQNSEATTAAQYAFGQIRDAIQQNPEINYWQGYNELAKDHNMSWVNDYEMEFMNQIDTQTSTNACIGNFKERSGQDFTNFLNSLPSLQDGLQEAITYANNHDHALCLHEHDSSTSPNPTWSIGGHYRQIHDALSPPPSRVIITVAGFDSEAGSSTLDSGHGWNGFLSAETYLQWLQSYADMINSDRSYVLGASIFAYGLPNWEGYDIRPLLQ